MAVNIGSKRQVTLNKYLLFDILGQVFSDYQTVQILTLVSRKTHSLLSQNTELIFRMTQPKHLMLKSATPIKLDSIKFLSRVPLLCLANSEVSSMTELAENSKYLNS